VIRCDLVLTVAGAMTDNLKVTTCPCEATIFVRSAFGRVYAYCEMHSRMPSLGAGYYSAGGEAFITREEYLVHKIMES